MATAAEAATRSRLPALQAAYDAAYRRAVELAEAEGAAAEAPAHLTKGAPPAVRRAVAVAAALVGPARVQAVAEMDAAREALVAARRDLLPTGEHPEPAALGRRLAALRGAALGTDPERAEAALAELVALVGAPGEAGAGG
jgi:hypothetical protein